MGWKLASMAHFFKSTTPRALALLSMCTSCQVLWQLSNISCMGAVITQCFICWNAVSYDLPYAKLASFCVSMYKSSTILLNPLISFQKNYTKPRNNCSYYTVVGFGHFLRLYTLASLVFRPFRVMSKSGKVVILCRKLHFFSLQ